MGDHSTDRLKGSAGIAVSRGTTSVTSCKLLRSVMDTTARACSVVSTVPRGKLSYVRTIYFEVDGSGLIWIQMRICLLICSLDMANRENRPIRSCKRGCSFVSNKKCFIQPPATMVAAGHQNSFCCNTEPQKQELTYRTCGPVCKVTEGQFHLVTGAAPPLAAQTH